MALPSLFQSLHSRATITVADLETRRRNDHRSVEEVWIFLGSVLAFFTIVNVARKTYAKFARHSPSPAANPTTPVDEEKVDSQHNPARKPGSRCQRISSAIATAFRIFAFRWTITIGPAMLPSISELAFIFIYISANLIWLLVDTRHLQLNFYKSRAGMIATSQLPLVVALASKNNIISILTGVSHEKLNVLHRAAGRTMFVFLWIHAIGRVATGLPPTITFELSFMRAGISGITCLTIGVFLSLRIFRQAMFEFFFIAHVLLMLGFLISGLIHLHPIGYGNYVWPAFLIWGLDRCVRGVMLLLNNVWRCNESTKVKATAELLGTDTVRLTMQRKFNWRPGQHAYVCLPTISKIPFEAHPFTIASIPDNLDGTKTEEKSVVFLIRSRTGLTRRLKEYVKTNGTGTVTAYVDGPYGCPPNLHSFSSSVLVAGGSGISYTLPLLMDLIRRSVIGGNSEVRRILFVWVVRGDGHLPWINETLSEALAMVKAPLNVDACIYITGANIARGTKRSNSFSTSEKDTYIEPEAIETSNAKVYHGRPDIRKLLHDEISVASGPVSVDIAGPGGLTASVQEALSSGVATAGEVLKGTPSVTLHVETFGMVKTG